MKYAEHVSTVGLALALSMFAACAGAAAVANDDPEAMLLDIKRAIATPQVVTDFCIQQYPASAQALRAAFVAWQRKNADLMFEVETRADRLTRGNSAGDEAEYKKRIETEKAALTQYRAAYTAELRRMPASASGPACAKYGTDLTNGEVNVSDLEKMFEAQLKVIRRRDPERGSR